MDDGRELGAYTAWDAASASASAAAAPPASDSLAGAYAAFVAASAGGASREAAASTTTTAALRGPLPGLSVDGSSAGFDRDFQSLIETCFEKDADMLSMPGVVERLTRLFKDFKHAALAYGRVIVAERHLPAEAKSIRPLGAAWGGIAGGEKFLAGGIFFRFTVESEARLYGSDELAAKESNHQMRGLWSVQNAGVAGLALPLAAVLKYRGFKLVAMSVLPLRGAESLVLGSADGGRSLRVGDARAEQLMASVGSALNLARHPVQSGTSQEWITGPADVEVHLVSHAGRDRFYAIDFARLFPPHPPAPVLARLLEESAEPPGGWSRDQQHEQRPRPLLYARKASHLVYMLRPELVMQSDKPLSSDAFSRFAAPGSEVFDEDVVSATKLLLRVALPAATRVLEAKGREAALLRRPGWRQQLQLDLVQTLHEFGVNMRFLGVVFVQAGEAELRIALLLEAVARVTKALVRAAERQVSVAVRTAVHSPYVQEALHQTNLVVGRTSCCAPSLVRGVQGILSRVAAGSPGNLLVGTGNCANAEKVCPVGLCEHRCLCECLDSDCPTAQAGLTGGKDWSLLYEEEGSLQLARQLSGGPLHELDRGEHRNEAPRRAFWCRRIRTLIAERFLFPAEESLLAAVRSLAGAGCGCCNCSWRRVVEPARLFGRVQSMLGIELEPHVQHALDAAEAVAEALPPDDTGGLPESTTSEEPPSSCVLPSFIRLSSVLSDSGGYAGDGGKEDEHELGPRVIDAESADVPTLSNEDSYGLGPSLVSRSPTESLSASASASASASPPSSVASATASATLSRGARWAADTRRVGRGGSRVMSRFELLEPFSTHDVVDVHGTAVLPPAADCVEGAEALLRSRELAANSVGAAQAAPLLRFAELRLCAGLRRSPTDPRLLCALGSALALRAGSDRRASSEPPGAQPPRLPVAIVSGEGPAAALECFAVSAALNPTHALSWYNAAVALLDRFTTLGNRLFLSDPLLQVAAALAGVDLEAAARDANYASRAGGSATSAFGQGQGGKPAHADAPRAAGSWRQRHYVRPRVDTISEPVRAVIARLHAAGARRAEQQQLQQQLQQQQQQQQQPLLPCPGPLDTSIRRRTVAADDASSVALQLVDLFFRTTLRFASERQRNLRGFLVQYGAFVQHYLGRRQAAMELFKRAVGKEDDSVADGSGSRSRLASALRRLLFLQMDLELWDDAAATAERTLHTYPTDFDANCTSGLVSLCRLTLEDGQQPFFTRTFGKSKQQQLREDKLSRRQGPANAAASESAQSPSSPKPARLSAEAWALRGRLATRAIETVHMAVALMERTARKDRERGGTSTRYFERASRLQHAETSLAACKLLTKIARLSFECAQRHAQRLSEELPLPPGVASASVMVTTTLSELAWTAFEWARRVVLDDPLYRDLADVRAPFWASMEQSCYQQIRTALGASHLACARALVFLAEPALELDGAWRSDCVEEEALLRKALRAGAPARGELDVHGFSAATAEGQVALAKAWEMLCAALELDRRWYCAAESMAAQLLLELCKDSALDWAARCISRRHD